METEYFDIVYSGKKAPDMEAHEVAEIMIATGNLIKETNRVVNENEEQDLVVSVRGFGKEENAYRIKFSVSKVKETQPENQTVKELLETIGFFKSNETSSLMEFMERMNT